MMTDNVKYGKISYQELLAEALDLIKELSDDQLKTLIEQMQEGK